MRFRRTLLIATLLLAAPLSFAATERGVMVRVAHIYLSPDAGSPKIATIDRGREVAVIEKSRDWVHVLATLSEPTETSEGRDVTGWILDKGVGSGWVEGNTRQGPLFFDFHQRPVEVDDGFHMDG